MNVPGGSPPDYLDLAIDLLQAGQRSFRRKLLGMVLAAVGSTIGLLFFSLTAVAAAWNTPQRWIILLLTAGIWLALGGAGVWLFIRPADDERARRTYAQLAELKARLQAPDTNTEDSPSFQPRSRTMRALTSLGKSRIPWLRLGLSALLFRRTARLP